ncbi:hypothetical protein SAMN05444678_101397 [Sphingomonas sp. YR710]|jgi:hypothetical protein|uniref:hypothetical protein n=1 Tax=Sphingomonas sp. YR710 TaxID=1882773 RepID=UPI0008811B1F|nr:hypothetical protein [Sphingomonas sp. YR710]SDC11930.1 hypothetical protein SAMN05444678_101397 [Sphingomonas sp. YR710]
MGQARMLPPRARPLIIAAARRWRAARDLGEAVQPALFTTLERAGCGVLAPVLDSLIRMFEVSSGQGFQVARSSNGGLSRDERTLLAMLEVDYGERMMVRSAGDRRLGAAMTVAIRSARIMIRLALRNGSSDCGPRLCATPA